MLIVIINILSVSYIPDFFVGSVGNVCVRLLYGGGLELSTIALLAPFCAENICHTYQ